VRHWFEDLQSTLRQHLAKSNDDRTRLLAGRVRDLEDESVHQLPERARENAPRRR
jgi:hypothetical protein